MVSFPGLDEASPLPDLVVDLWARSNLWFAGFYLAHDWTDAETTWMTLGGTAGWGLPHDGLWVARDCGWRIWPVWLPFGNPIGQMTSAATGRDHGTRALAAAVSAHLERSATIYVDVETGMPQTQPDWKGFIDYLEAWSGAVVAGGYRAGAYVSRSNVAALLAEARLAGVGLGVAGAGLKPTPTTFALWPFSIDGRQSPPANFVRAPWDDANSRATPLAPADWPLGSPGHKDPWGLDWRVVGCQHDWRNAQTQPRPGQVLTQQQQADLKGFHVRPFIPVCRPSTAGTTPAATRFQDLDVDSARSSDPAHPYAAVVVAVSQEAAAPVVGRLYAVCRDHVLAAVRFGWSANWTPHASLAPATSPDDIWPPDPPSASDPDPGRLSRGFDVSDAAAASRASRHHDLFCLGIDGTVVTTWENPVGFYPKHRWELNWRPASGRVVARRGGPIAAAGMAGRLDVLYAANDHRLVHQWWSPAEANWNQQGMYVEPTSGCALVAPASGLVALPERAIGTGGAMRLHVLFVGFSFSRYPNPPLWGGRRGSRETQAQFAQRQARHRSALSTWRADVDAWRSGAFPVWHAIGQLTSPPTWQLSPVTGLGSVAPSAGIAAAMTGDGRVHVVVQPSTRASLLHAIYDGGAWSAPVNVPAPSALSGQHSPRSASSFALAASGPLLMCAAVDVERRLVWASYDGAKWSAPQETPTLLNPAARLRAAAAALPTASQPGYIDVIGAGDEGQVVIHELTANRTDFSLGRVATLAWPGPSAGPP